MTAECKTTSVHSSDSSGFTLAELMIASGVFVIMVAAFTYGYIDAMKLHVMSADYYNATCLARNRIQRAKSVDFSSLSLIAESNKAIDAFGNYDSVGRFSRTVIVSNLAADKTEIVVQIYYPGSTNRSAGAKPVEIRTVIRNGM